jgi:hypothetical protein
MGRLLQPRGLKGELRLTIFNKVDSVLKVGMEIWVATAERLQYSHISIPTFKTESTLLKIVNLNSPFSPLGFNNLPMGTKSGGN